MLLKTYNFTGKHATYMANLVGDELKEDKNKEETSSESENNMNSEVTVRPHFFKRNIDVMFAAAILGFKLNRKGQYENSSERKRTILNEQIISNHKTIQFIYRLIVLLDKNTDEALHDRLNVAFSRSTTEIEKDTENIANSVDSKLDEKYEALFYQYILGGIEYLYENLIGNGKDYIDNIGQLLDDFKYQMDEKVINNIPII